MSSLSRRPSCPCCVFLTQDLFLPPSQSTTTTEPTATDEPALPSSDVVSPPEALSIIQQHAQQLKLEDGRPAALLVDTHNHAHLKRERHSSYELPLHQKEGDSARGSNLPVFSLTLAVEPADWDHALRFSAEAEDSSPDTTIMGLGVHPWYLGDSVEPQGPWKERLDALLREHPSCIVGEVGLCKMAKCARTHPEGKRRGFEIQRAVLEDQIQLAVQHQRPVSIHCVQQHGVFWDFLKEILTKYKANGNGTNPFRFVPPAMAMHSFTGTAHHVKQLIQWEATLFGEGPNDSKKKKKKQSTEGETEKEQQAPRPPLLYFGFSHIVNYAMCTSDKARRQGREAVRAVPSDRLMAESDVHHPGDVPAGTAGAIAYMAWALEEPIPMVAERTAKNGLAFLRSHLGDA